MTKGTSSMGKKSRRRTVMKCRRCGKSSYHKTKKICASCGFGRTSKLRKYNWQKARKRK